MSDYPSPDEVVRSLCDAWATHDLDTIVAHFSEEAVYHNMPLEPARGIDAVRTTVQGLLAMASRIEFEILEQVSSGSMVMNERIDTIVMGDATTALPVAGAFEVTDGKITAWRDYFDMGQFTGG